MTTDHEAKTMRRVAVIIIAWAGLLIGIPSPPAQAEPTRVTVGTKVAPPFVLKQADGRWSGISVELWERVAEELGLAYTWRELDLDDLLRDVQGGALEAGVAALTITPAREEAIDFSHPFYVSGLGIVVPSQGRPGWAHVLQQLFSWEFVRAVIVLALVVCVAGLLVWIFERRRNPEQFGGNALQGIGAGFWWSAVTMTTVGYGDKAPKTVGGRFVALIWMFGAILIISSLTAAIASALTVSRLATDIRGPEDLAGRRVGTVADTTSQQYLQHHYIRHLTAPSVEAGLTLVEQGELEAFVYDAPMLQYLARTRFRGTVQVLQPVFEQQHYGIALPQGSELREPVNRALLQITASEAWRQVLERYVGS